MNSSSLNIEREVLEEIARKFTAQGYTLIRQPARNTLPSFFGNFQPDAIAIGKSPKFIIEVMTRRGSAEVEATKIKQLQRMLEGHDEWRLEVVYTTPSSVSPGIATLPAIRARFEQIKSLSAADRPAALILAWSMLEAACRAALPDRAGRPLTPATAVEFLASLGYITQSEADMLREAARARNLIVHGDLGQDVSPVLLAEVLDVIDALIHRLDNEAIN